jgi:putative ABC transport system permease protein
VIRSYFKTAWRILTRNKTFSVINIAGLAVGFTCFILIYAYVIDELSYDRYPVDARDIYRVQLSITGNGTIAEYPAVDAAVGKGMMDVFPEIKSSTRLVSVSDFVRNGDKQFKEDRLAFADSNFLEIFSIPLIEGNRNGALVQPNSIVISREFATKYFGNTDPLGKSLIVGLKGALYNVTGVYGKVPDNSHFHFDAFMSLTTFPFRKPTWSNLGYYTYLVLDDQADPKTLESKFPELVKKYVVPEIQNDMGVSYEDALKAADNFRFSLMPLTDIHLYSHTRYELEPNGDIQYVYIFSALAVLILLLACVNFTNLSTARAEKRAKEIGIRKVVGSRRIQLVIQLLSESLLISFFAIFLAALFIDQLLPVFNAISGKHLVPAFFLTPGNIIMIAMLVLIIGILAGLYPAFFLSSFSANKTLKGVSVTRDQKNALRSSLIIFQFLVSIGIVIATIVIYRQLLYLQNRKLGFDKEEVLYLPDGRLLGKNQSAFKERLLQDSRVVSASISRCVPGTPFMGGTEIFAKNEGADGPEIHTNIYYVDYDYMRTLGIRLAQGRFFSREFGSDSLNVVINQTAVRELGWGGTNPIGKTIVRSGGQNFKVIGVVADFTYSSAKQRIAPLMMVLGDNYGGIIIKIGTNDIPGFLSDLRSEWNSFSPQGPLNYTFLDETFAALYTSEQKTEQLFSLFALIAILIAALGLFGLSAYIIERRTKEIGIRKVLGASVPSVLYLLTMDFVRWIIISNIIAWPIAWYAMNKWLQDFAYRVDISWWPFAIAGVGALAVAMATISLHAVKAVTANPVKSLRYE